MWPCVELEERRLKGGERREDKDGGNEGAKKWMERVQSKFVIVKQMKELRFCGGVNIELANLWTLKLALLTATVTPSPICISVGLNHTGSVNPEIKLHVKNICILKAQTNFLTF